MGTSKLNTFATDNMQHTTPDVFIWDSVQRYVVVGSSYNGTKAIWDSVNSSSFPNGNKIQFATLHYRNQVPVGDSTWCMYVYDGSTYTRFGFTQFGSHYLFIDQVGSRLSSLLTGTEDEKSSQFQIAAVTFYSFVAVIEEDNTMKFYWKITGTEYDGEDLSGYTLACEIQLSFGAVQEIGIVNIFDGGPFPSNTLQWRHLDLYSDYIPQPIGFDPEFKFFDTNYRRTISQGGQARLLSWNPHGTEITVGGIQATQSGTVQQQMRKVVTQFDSLSNPIFKGEVISAEVSAGNLTFHVEEVLRKTRYYMVNRNPLLLATSIRYLAQPKTLYDRGGNFNELFDINDHLLFEKSDRTKFSAGVDFATGINYYYTDFDEWDDASFTVDETQGSDNLLYFYDTVLEDDSLQAKSAYHQNAGNIRLIGDFYARLDTRLFTKFEVFIEDIDIELQLAWRERDDWSSQGINIHWDEPYIFLQRQFGGDRLKLENVDVDKMSRDSINQNSINDQARTPVMPYNINIIERMEEVDGVASIWNSETTYGEGNRVTYLGKKYTHLWDHYSLNRTVDIDADNGEGKGTLFLSGGNWTSDDWRVGQTVTLTLADSNNGDYVIEAITSTLMTFTTPTAGSDSSSDGITITLKREGNTPIQAHEAGGLYWFNTIYEFLELVGSEATDNTEFSEYVFKPCVTSGSHVGYGVTPTSTNYLHIFKYIAIAQLSGNSDPEVTDAAMTTVASDNVVLTSYQPDENGIGIGDVMIVGENIHNFITNAWSASPINDFMTLDFSVTGAISVILKIDYTYRSFYDLLQAVCDQLNAVYWYDYDNDAVVVRHVNSLESTAITLTAADLVDYEDGGYTYTIDSSPERGTLVIVGDGVIYTKDLSNDTEHSHGLGVETEIHDDPSVFTSEQASVLADGLQYRFINAKREFQVVVDFSEPNQSYSNIKVGKTIALKLPTSSDTSICEFTTAADGELLITAMEHDTNEETGFNEYVVLSLQRRWS